MKNFKAVIFDMDGLLLDSERIVLGVFHATCASFGLGDLTEVFRRCIGTNPAMSDSILRDGLAGIVDFEEFNLVWERELKRVMEAGPIPLKSGARELLKHMESIDIPMAVATSTNTERAKERLEASGILNHFKILIGGDQVERSKPAPDIYLKAAFELSFDPCDCLVLEDSANGVKAAVGAGMTVVQIPDLVQPDEELLKLGHIVLHGLSDVWEHLLVK